MEPPRPPPFKFRRDAPRLEDAIPEGEIRDHLVEHRRCWEVDILKSRLARISAVDPGGADEARRLVDEIRLLESRAPRPGPRPRATSARPRIEKFLLDASTREWFSSKQIAAALKVTRESVRTWFTRNADKKRFESRRGTDPGYRARHRDVT